MIDKNVHYFDGFIRLNGKKVKQLENDFELERGPIKIIHEPITMPTRRIQPPIDENNCRMDKLNRRWGFLASLDGDPLIIDGIVFKFHSSLYTNNL